MDFMDVGEGRSHVVWRAHEQRMVGSRFEVDPASRKIVANVLRGRALARTRKAIDEQHLRACHGYSEPLEEWLACPQTTRRHPSIGGLLRQTVGSTGASGQGRGLQWTNDI